MQPKATQGDCILELTAKRWFDYGRRVAATDRAFRALGRDEPQTLVALVDVLVPDLLPTGLAAHSLTARDPRLDTPDPSIEADAAFVDEASQRLWHLEGQGYDEQGFLDRVLRYHLGFVLRFWNYEVRSVVLWMRPPAPEQRVPLLRKGSVSVLVTHLVLREARASRLVQHEQTACFAPAASDEGRGDEIVCQQTVAILRESNASLRRWQMAAVAARSHSRERYRAMVKAMEQAGVRSVIIEDLLKIGEEFGIEKGIEKGRDEGELLGSRRALTRVLGKRGFELTPSQHERIQGCSDASTLERWLDQAVVASSAEEALS